MPQRPNKHNRVSCLYCNSASQHPCGTQNLSGLTLSPPLSPAPGEVTQPAQLDQMK